MNTIKITSLHKKYKNGVIALDDISLEIENGMFGLLGPNGAGKSSLMKTMAGLQKADSGEIWFNGVNVLEDTSFIKKQLGFLPQDFGVYPKVSAYDLLNHLAVLKGMQDKKKRKEQILELLEKVNLYQQRNREVHTFSGGMKQRFGVAQALLSNPQIIIVDEPTAGLDPEERNRFNFLLSSISQEVIVILSTHLVEDVKNLCTKMAVIQNGRLICFGTPSEFIAEIDGKIWTRPVSGTALTNDQSQYPVISYQFAEGKMFIIVFAEEPVEGFRLLEPTLEHFYFYMLNHKNQLS